MAVCRNCHEEMKEHRSCCWPVVIIKRKSYPRLRYGKETRYGTRLPDYWTAYGENCPDCSVVLGGLHHVGCDWEQCPRCGGQFIGCDCGWRQFREESGATNS